MLRIALFCVSLLLLAVPAFTQDLPKQIRGYSVHREKVVIKTTTDATASDDADAVITFGDPTPADVSLSGVSFELAAKFVAERQSGRVHFMTFHDFRVNGWKVTISEYGHQFAFRKGEMTRLPKPVSILIPMTSLIGTAWREASDSKAEWTITGRVFVFGKFRKFGFYHKRVVPIDIAIKIKNPVKLQVLVLNGLERRRPALVPASSLDLPLAR